MNLLIILNSIKKDKNLLKKENRALKDLNPRHLILETSVLPTELRTHYNNYSIIKLKLQYFISIN